MPAMGVAGCRHFKSAIPRTWAARTETVSVGMLRAVCAWHVGGGMVGDAAVTAVSKRGCLAGVWVRWLCVCVVSGAWVAVTVTSAAVTVTVTGKGGKAVTGSYCYTCMAVGAHTRNASDAPPHCICPWRPRQTLDFKFPGLVLRDATQHAQNSDGVRTRRV